MQQVNSVSNVSKDSGDNVIRFNMKSDQAIRDIAQHGYTVSKHLREAGLKFKRLVPAATDLSVRKQFNLPVDSELISLEISVGGKSDTDKQLLIQDTKDTLLILDGIKLVAEKQYAYDPSNVVYRFLLQQTKGTSQK